MPMGRAGCAPSAARSAASSFSLLEPVCASTTCTRARATRRAPFAQHPQTSQAVCRCRALHAPTSPSLTMMKAGVDRILRRFLKMLLVCAAHTSEGASQRGRSVICALVSRRKHALALPIRQASPSLTCSLAFPKILTHVVCRQQTAHEPARSMHAVRRPVPRRPCTLPTPAPAHSRSPCRRRPASATAAAPPCRAGTT